MYPHTFCFLTMVLGYHPIARSGYQTYSEPSFRAGFPELWVAGPVLYE